MSLDQTLQHWLSRVAGSTRLSRRLTYGLAEVLPYLLAACWVLAVVSVRPLQANSHWYAAICIGALFARFAIVGVVSLLVHRDRPYLVAHENPIIHPLTKGSFPSGHAVVLAYAAVVYAVAAPHLFPEWFASLCAIAAVSRIAADVHYPSDILAGAAIGGLSAGVVLRFFT